MVKLPTREVATGELVSGVIGTIDIGTIIQRSINVQQDITRSSEVRDRIINYVNNVLPILLANAKNRVRKTAPEILNEAQTFLPSYLSFIIKNIQNQAVQSATGFSATASMLAQETKFYTALNQVDLLSSVLFDIPALAAKTKAVRYWNKELSPEYPNERDSFMLYRLGKWQRVDFVNYLREDQGLKPTDAENITEIREWQIGKPSLRDAYLMVQKGFKTKDYFLDIAIKGFGFTPLDADALYRHFSYDFSPTELLRLSDLIPLESDWVEKKLNAVGMDISDKLIFKAALEKRTVRDEINKAWTLILDAYQWGLFTKADLTELLQNWKFSQQEINLRLQTGDLLKLKLRVKLLRDAEIYLYRQEVITETELLTRLINLGISKDIANAIVRYEAAKRGVDWEIPEG
jgi:predicted transcriptional regulator